MSDADDKPWEREAVAELLAPSPESLAAGQAENQERADDILDQFDAWLNGQGAAPPVYHASSGPPAGVDVWVSYQDSTPGSRYTPTASGMAHWTDEAGGGHTEITDKPISHRLTDQQKRHLGL